MPSKSRPMSKTEIAAYEAGRDLAAELLKSVREMKAGKVRVVDSPVVEARKKTGLCPIAVRCAARRLGADASRLGTGAKAAEWRGADPSRHRQHRIPRPCLRLSTSSAQIAHLSRRPTPVPSQPSSDRLEIERIRSIPARSPHGQDDAGT